jgi:hypothetical protein
MNAIALSCRSAFFPKGVRFLKFSMYADAQKSRVYAPQRGEMKASNDVAELQ